MLQTTQSSYHFSRTCLSKTTIISDVIDFIKAISCSGKTHVSTKQSVAAVYADFQYLRKKNATKYIKFDFFSIFCVICSKHFPWVINFEKFS